MVLIQYAEPSTNTFYSSFDAYVFHVYSENNKEKMKDAKKWKVIQSLLESTSINSNPIIFKLRINDDMFDY